MLKLLLYHLACLFINLIFVGFLLPQSHPVTDVSFCVITVYYIWSQKCRI